MKVFVFKPSNENIGNFRIDAFEELDTAFQAFAETCRVSPYDYLECSGRSWTVMEGENGLSLTEGRLHPTKQRKLPESPAVVAPSKPESASRYPALEILSVIYRILAYVTGVVALIIVIIGVMTIDRGGASLIIGGLLGGIVGVITNLAIAEGIKVFTAIEENTRNTALSLSAQSKGEAP